MSSLFRAFSRHVTKSIASQNQLQPLVCQSEVVKRSLGAFAKVFSKATSPKAFHHHGHTCATAIASSSEQQQPVSSSSSSVQPKILNVDEKGVEIAFGSGLIHRFNLTWLRHNCGCSACVEPSSGQKIANILDLTTHNPIAAIDVNAADDTISIVWETDSHRSVYPVSLLHNIALPSKDKSSPPPVLKSIPRLSLAHVLDDEKELHGWLHTLAVHGVAVLEGEDVKEGLVLELAQRICPPMHTIYGTVFDVVSTPNPINVAYSPLMLDVHQDLVYYESPPGLQFLHCRCFAPSVVGGNSTIVDGFALLEAFREKDPSSFEILTKIPTRFQKIHYRREQPVHITYSRPIIELNFRGEIINFSWAPPFEAPQRDLSDSDMADYYHAYTSLLSIMARWSPFEFRLKPGEILTFNNRRMLHGRTMFTSEKHGDRHLQGTYVNIDEFKNKYRVLSSKYGYGQEEALFHVCNRDFD